MTGAALPSTLAALDPAELAAPIARLPEDERAVASDRLEERLAFGTIAARRGLDPDEVARRYRRAVRRLHRRLRLNPAQLYAPTIHQPTLRVACNHHASA
jgi:DNA-directed RNA polymerase specialized sigma24 family protein